MTELQRLLAVGGMLNSALYLAGCFVAGLYAGNGIAWRLRLLALGAAYFSYNMQAIGHRSAPAFLWLSIAVGAAAGLALLGRV